MSLLLLDVAPPVEMLAFGGIILVIVFVLIVSAISLTAFLLWRYFRRRRAS